MSIITLQHLDGVRVAGALIETENVRAILDSRGEVIATSAEEAAELLELGCFRRVPTIKHQWRPAKPGISERTES